jgi:hypothetical protein
MGVSRTICPGWPRTEILPISASQGTRITGGRHWRLAGIAQGGGSELGPLCRSDDFSVGLLET